MDLIPILSLVIVVAILVTVIYAVATYTAFKLRERRSPERLKEGLKKRTYFRKYTVAS